MKKALCLLLAVLIMFSAFGMTVFAAPETEAMPDADADSLVRYTVQKRAIGGTTVIMDKGEVITFHYQKMDYGPNVDVPKGGRIEWTIMQCGGDVLCKLSDDKKTCTVIGSDAGCCTIAAKVYDAAGNRLSSGSENLRVRNPGVMEFFNTITLEAFSRTVMWFHLLLYFSGAKDPARIG